MAWAFKKILSTYNNSSISKWQKIEEDGNRAKKNPWPITKAALPVHTPVAKKDKNQNWVKLTQSMTRDHLFLWCLSSQHGKRDPTQG